MNKILAEHFMDPAEIVGGGEEKPKIERSAVVSGSGAKVEPGPVRVPVGRSAEVVYSEDEDEDDDY